MELYYSFSILIVLASFFAYLNLRFLRLPGTIGIMLMAIIVSIVIRVAGPYLMPDTAGRLITMLKELDFTEVLMGAMLNFLLFAGAIHVNLADLREHRGPILTFSTLSVVISSFVAGALLYWTAPLFKLQVPFIYCLVFGALISPTDPIAVLGILRKAGVPKSLETKIAGESLFNDGIAVVLFAVILQMAYTPDTDLTFTSVSWLLAKEAGGGLVLGVLVGFTASRAIQRIDDYIVSVLITLSVVMGGYLIAHALHMSGPLTMVAAGLIIGNYGKKVIMSEATHDYLNKFWELLDEILNALLFLFIGFELLLIPDITEHWMMGVATIAIVLMARALSIVLPAVVLPRKFGHGTLVMLIWGGLRGGVSIALVLTMKDGPHKDLLLEITYFVVVFSILVQGLTIGKVARRVLKDA